MSVLVRDGTKDDIRRIVEMAEEFWGHTMYDETYCPDTVACLADTCIDQGLMAVLESGGKVEGFACGVKGALIGNGTVTSGTELAWWISPEHRRGGGGVRLLRHLEELARRAGMRYWNMAYMESSMPEYVKKLYESLGYSRSEVIYTRIL